MYNLIKKVIIGILFIWMCLSFRQMIIYEPGVYDCSNMVADQEHFFDSIGINTKIGLRHETVDKVGHAWLIFPFNIPFECTILFINPFNCKPDEVFDSVEELVSTHPSLKHEFIASR